jgi:hypothetical protein
VISRLALGVATQFADCLGVVNRQLDEQRKWEFVGARRVRFRRDCCFLGHRTLLDVFVSVLETLVGDYSEPVAAYQHEA